MNQPNTEKKRHKVRLTTRFALLIGLVMAPLLLTAVGGYFMHRHAQAALDETMAETLDDLIAAARMQSALLQARSPRDIHLFQPNQGKIENYSDLNSEVDKTYEDARRKIIELREQEKLKLLQFDFGIGFLLISTLLFAIVVVRLLRQNVVQYIEHLEFGAIRIGRGELGLRMELDRTDELGELANAFNYMAEKLEHNHHIEVERNKALELANEELQQESARHQEIALQREKFFRTIEDTDDYVIFTDENGVIEYANPAVVHATGFQQQDLLGNKTSLFRSGNHDDQFYADMWQTISRGDTFRDVFVNRKKDGSLFYEEKTITPMVDGQGKRHYVSTGRDVTEQMETHDRLHYMAHHDILTGLGNRVTLVDHLEQALTRADRNETMVGVLFLDLDRFKPINDTLGHTVGDELLKEIARRLGDCTREGDTVARLGGDEFVIIADGVKHITDVTHLVDRVISAVSETIVIKSNDLNITTSIGITLYPLDHDNVDGLIKHADVAMYRAKQEGCNAYEFYTHDMTKQVNARVKLEDDLRLAAQNQEFVLHYLPEVDLDTGAVVGLEALLRWHTSDGSVVAPDQFLSVLEDTGMILDVGEWVLHEACGFLCRLHESGFTDLRMSVNLSAKQFQQTDMVRIVSEAMEISPANRLCLELEVTEPMLVDNLEDSNIQLTRLSSLGVSIAIDDFGIGYSSLRSLKRLPIDVLKIDRSFINVLTADAESDSIVDAAIALAHSLQLEVVAEGVETERQQAYLQQRDCDRAQGYLYSPPLPEQEITAWLGKCGLKDAV